MNKHVSSEMSLLFFFLIPLKPLIFTSYFKTEARKNNWLWELCAHMKDLLRTRFILGRWNSKLFFCLFVCFSFENFVHITPPYFNSSSAYLDLFQIHNIFFKCVCICAYVCVYMWYINITRSDHLGMDNLCGR